MSQIKYPGDPHTYTRYKHTDGKYYVKCEARMGIAGVPHICKYKHKREDRHKRAIANKQIHKCEFEPIKDHTTNTILDYYQPITTKNELKIDFSDSGLKQRLAILLAQKNISIDAGASDEMYNFIIYCISYGMSYNNKENAKLVEKAKQAYPHYKSDSIRQAMIMAAKLLDKDMLEQYKALDYVCISLDKDMLEQQSCWTNKR